MFVVREATGTPPSFHSETRQIFIREVEFKCIMIPVFIIFPQVIRSDDAISVRSRDITVIMMLVVMVMVLRDDHIGDTALGGRKQGLRC